MLAWIERIFKYELINCLNFNELIFNEQIESKLSLVKNEGLTCFYGRY